MIENQELENTSIILLNSIEKRILTIRGSKIMLDSDLAELYGVTTKRLNEQVKRNRQRFPVDFMFRLTEHEKEEVVANCDHLSRLKYSKYLPYAFTEHGAIMVAAVLNTSRAVGVSIYVVRAFVKLREMLSEHKELALKLVDLDKKVAVHDVSIKYLVETIHRLANPGTKKKRRRVGFGSDLSLDEEK
jgi:phage regulator Rha-like protein